MLDQDLNHCRPMFTSGEHARLVVAEGPQSLAGIGCASVAESFADRTHSDFKALFGERRIHHEMVPGKFRFATWRKQNI